MTEIRDEDLGDPSEVRPDDPKEIMVRLSGRDFQACIAGLGELPAKLSRGTINTLEAQMRASVLAHRRMLAERRAAGEAAAAQAAADRRTKKEARRAARNGHAAPSPTVAGTPPSS